MGKQAGFCGTDPLPRVYLYFDKREGLGTCLCGN